MKKRKTKGSSMILVIAIFGILATLGLAMIGTTYANYKMRIEENNRVKNLYSAESGIDKAYVKMSNVVEDGISEGIKAVENAISDASNSASNKPEDKVVTIKEQNEIFKQKYTKYIVKSLGSTESNKVSGEYEVSDNKATVVCELKDKVAEEGKSRNKELTDTVGDKVAKLTSSYKDSNGKERVVSVSYALTVPEDFRTVDKTNGEVSSVLNYSIATDENLIIKNNDGTSTEMAIDGDIWVQGTRSDKIVESPTIDKYKGGIEITNTDVDFVGQVNTASNILVDGSKVEFKSNDKDSEGKQINTNVFAENIFLGELESDDSNGIELNGGMANMYLANDLVISSSDAKVDINNLYGFNDINVKNEKEARESSSIIINSMTWPKSKSNISERNGYINIKESAYIMGSAYIKTTDETPYQTGESVALKGNYKAYTQPVIDKDGNILYDKYKFEYLNPLVLVTTNEKGEELRLEEKAKYFEDYSNSKDAQLRTTGISLPTDKTYTAGAYISSDKVNGSKATAENQSVDIAKLKGEFVKSVYYMNSDSYKDATLNEDFLGGKPKNTVASEINWNGVDNLISERGNIIDLGDIKVILNNKDDSIIEVTDNKIKILDENSKVSSEVAYDSKYKYVIVTKGYVNFKNSNGYNGTVISLKDINLSNQKGAVGLETTLTAEELKDSKGILDFIFSKGESLVTERVVKAADIISQEKWTLEK